MYMFRVPALSPTAADYVAFSHGGHGANSYAINYFLVDGPLALFVQSPWGRTYSDMKRDARSVKRLFDRCAALIDAMERAKALGCGADTRKQLVVVESEFRGQCAWGWMDAQTIGKRTDRQWTQAPSRTPDEPELPTKAALQWLRGEITRREAAAKGTI